MTLPLVSVLMAVHDGGPYLREAVQSILNQEFEDFEFLVLDDASGDGSWDVLSELGRKDERVKVFRNLENAGLTRSLERLMREVRGVFVARMDADDVSLPGRLARQVEHFERDARLGVVGTWVRNVLDDGTPIEDVCYPDSHRWIARQLRRRNCLTHGSVMIRTSCLKGLRPPIWRFRYGQDYDLYLRLVDRCRFGIVQSVLYVSRCHSGSICSRIDPIVRAGSMGIMRELQSLRRKGYAEFDWRARERELLSKSQDGGLKDGDAAGAYARALLEMPKRHGGGAGELFASCAGDPRLRAKARFLEWVSRFPDPVRALVLKGLRTTRVLRFPRERHLNRTAR